MRTIQRVGIIFLLILFAAAAMAQTPLRELKDLRPRSQATPAMTVYIEAGTVYVEGVRVVYAGGSSATFTAPTTNPRIDLVSLNSSGALVITQGAEAAFPTPPTFPTDKFPIVLVYHRVGETSIQAYNKSDGNGYLQHDVRAFAFWRSNSGTAPADAAYLTKAGNATLTGEVNVTALDQNLSLAGDQTAARTITLGGNSTYTDQIVFGGDATFQSALLPSATDAKDFGSLSLKWKDIYASGSLKDGTNSVTIANLKTAYDHASLTNNPHSTTLTQAEAAGGAITESAITDGAILARVAGNETITGKYNYTNGRMVLPNGLDAGKPSSGLVEGEPWWSTDSKKLQVYDGSSWSAINGDFAPVDSPYLTTAADGSLTGEVVTSALGQNFSLAGDQAAARTITLGGKSTYTDSVVIGGDLTVQNAFNPSVTGTKDLGSLSLKWQDIYCAGSLKDGTNSVTVGNLKAAYDHISSTANPHAVTLSQAETAGGSITESAVADGAIFPRLAANETITGKWNIGGGRFEIPNGLEANKPSTGLTEGEMWWSTDADSLQIYDGSDWTAVEGGGGSGGAPTDAEYLVTQSSPYLSAEKVIGSLGSTLTFGPNGAGITPLAVKGYSGQSADLFQARDSSNTALFRIGSAGSMYMIEAGSSPEYYSKFSTGDQSADLEYTLPTTISANGYLQTDDNGMLSWDALTAADVGLGNAENTALSTWAGSSNLTTLGTVGTGTWGATTIAVDKGGTGQTSYTDGQLLIGNSATGELSKATLTAGSNVTITNGNGSITIAASGSGSAPNSSQYLVLDYDANLSGERKLQGTTNQIAITDNGANGTAVLALPQDYHTSATPQLGRLGLGTAADGSAQLNLASGGNIKVAGANAKRTIVLTGAGGWPTTTNGCAPNVQIEAATNKQNYFALDFDPSTDENAEWTVFLPDNYDGDTVTAKFVWTTAGSSGDVVWGVKGRCYGDDDAIDQAYGTAQTVTDSTLAAGDVHISTATSAITLGGTPGGGKMAQLRVYRDADNGSDTLASDARLISVVIEYGISAYSD